MMDAFETYHKLIEPEKYEKRQIWETAIGLQKVDGLETSPYLIQTAKRNIEGEISFSQVKENLNFYYQNHQTNIAKDRTEEADKVSARIAEILGEKTFSFRVLEYISIHRRLFEGILVPELAGKIRPYNIEKKEWVLNGKTVYYASADDIKETLEYDFQTEKVFSYKGLSKQEMIVHIAKFTSDIWQIHAFGEGNTRATAVFMIKYLRSLGFEAENDLFAQHSRYFRKALVRANYNDLKNEIYATQDYLNRFFENLLLGGKHTLKSRELLISASEL